MTTRQNGQPIDIEFELDILLPEVNIKIFFFFFLHLIPQGAFEMDEDIMLCEGQLYGPSIEIVQIQLLVLRATLCYRLFSN